MQTDALNLACHTIQFKAFLFRHTDGSNTYRKRLLVYDLAEIIVYLTVLVGLAVKVRNQSLSRRKPTSSQIFTETW